ncbi:MAG: hypothetical protein LBK46_03070 [Oscillospiraceae bacterium]|nr:hypothetical protein [Oscillospiraceae bacterium]
MRHWCKRVALLAGLITVGLAAMVVSASAEIIVFPQSGVRLDAAPDEFVITPQTIGGQSDGLMERGIDSNALAASYYAEHTLFDIIRADGVRVMMSARDWPEADSADESSRRGAVESLAAFADSSYWLDGDWLRVTNAYDSIYQLKDAAMLNGALIELTARASYDAGTDAVQAALDSVKQRVDFIDKQPLGNVGSSDYTPAPLSGVARVVESSGALAFELTRLPAWTDDGQISASGTTQPGARVTLTVDGVEIARTRAGVDGTFAFEFTIDGENGGHDVAFTASHGGASARRVHSVLLALGVTPLVLQPNMERITGPFDLYVYTLPDAAIELTTPSRTMHGPANGSGYLYFSLSIRRGQSAVYQATATAAGLPPSTVELTLERELSEIEQIQDFRLYTQNVTYKKLVDNPEGAAGVNVELRGRVGAVEERDGLPALALYTSNPGSGSWQEPVFVYCDKLLQFAVGDVLTVLGVVRGDTAVIAGETMPAVDGKYYLR